LIKEGLLHFPGIDGIPFLGKKVPQIKDDDPPEKRPRSEPYAHVRVFDLSIENHIHAYEQISKRAASGRTQISFEERHFVEAKSSWLVLIRWIDYYAS